MPSVQIRQSRLAGLLRSFRESRDESQTAVETRLAELRQSTVATANSTLLAGGISSLESNSDRVIEVTTEELTLLAKAYQIQPLMLDPLLAQASAGSCVVHQLNQFREVSEHGGHFAEYSRPQRQLSRAAGVAFVHLSLEPGGISEIHAHPGDELMFVRKGTLEVRLSNSGLWTRLNQGDYIHFYAEQVHSAWNTGDGPAEIFVIRFFQHDQGTRYEFIDDLKKKRFPDRAVAEVVSALARFDLRPDRNVPHEVTDRAGFGRLLRLLCDPRFQPNRRRLSLTTLADRAKKLELDFSRSKFERLHHGRAPVSIDELGSLAFVYGTEPLFFYDFTFPALRDAIVVRDTDYHKVPDAFLRTAEVAYYVPCRRLSYSDVSIARLEIQPGKATLKNSHPGHELLFPLEGEATVHIEETSARVVFGEHLFAHYHSGLQHQVENSGSKLFRGLVMRFYEFPHQD